MRILVVDDEESILHLIRMNLEMERYEVVTACSGCEALAQFAAAKPEIVLLDISLPDMEGNEVLEQMKRLDSSVPIMMVTARDKMHSKLLSLQLGADDYIVKPFDLQELLLRIRVIARHLRQRGAVGQGEGAPTKKEPEYLTLGDLALDKRRMKVRVQNREVAVTHKEFQTLWLLCREKGVVFSREHLLEAVWEFDCEVNTRAVDILIARLRKKLGPEGGHIQTIYGVGYRYEE